VRFHICMVNHHPLARDTLAEQVTWLTEGLEALGHSVTYSDDHSDPDAINLLWEAFHPEFAERMCESGRRYGIIATEVPDGEGWNNARHLSWPDRWKGFEVAVKGAEFVWSLLPDAVPVYQKMGVRCAYLEYGFSERLLMTGETRDIDFFFYGGAGDHRRDKINVLAREGFNSIHPGTIVSAELRDAMMRRSKVVLGLKYHADWPYTSVSRVGRAILGGCAVAHEWTEKILRPCHLVPMAPKDADWVSFASQVMDKAKLHAESAIERYRLEMPIRQTTERALEGVL
jgi:hypothetical protein